MKKFVLFIGGILVVFSIYGCGKSSSVGPDPKPDRDPPVLTPSDELEFKVLVYVDKASVEAHLGGSERIVSSKMNELFKKVTSYWNESSKGKLKKKYRYTFTDMKIYEGSSQSATLRKVIYNDPVDFSKYDVTVFFDGIQDNGETGNGGAAHSGGTDNRSVVTVFANATEKKDIFNDNTFRTLTHELGHYRGVTDLYQYIIAANDNQVSHQKFDPPVCIMNDAASGLWSDYAAACINRAGSAKQIGKEFLDFFGSMYPKNIEINVTVSGTAKRGLDVKIYGSRAGASGRNRDIYPTAFLSGQTDIDGKFIMRDTKNLFIPDKGKFPNIPEDLPYGRWFGLLVEVSSGTTKKYAWLPEYEVQMPFFEGKDTYTANIAF
ncbi:hypothetical protein H9X96_19845 [Pedobacter sp. N36a]|uniref:hypothetical protein n=1 Tax=Pedobacter sp. N36a TaxID=2767996 RepID=UPI0016571542|nr:hypothetical protein [Pedobacter sp. N36a]MBC8988014.1 hypothetical protein [Pedobacter sp. N36a]